MGNLSDNDERMANGTELLELAEEFDDARQEAEAADAQATLEKLSAETPKKRVRNKNAVGTKKLKPSEKPNGRLSKRQKRKKRYLIGRTPLHQSMVLLQKVQ